MNSFYLASKGNAHPRAASTLAWLGLVPPHVEAVCLVCNCRKGVHCRFLKKERSIVRGHLKSVSCADPWRKQPINYLSIVRLLCLFGANCFAGVVLLGVL